MVRRIVGYVVRDRGVLDCGRAVGVLFPLAYISGKIAKIFSVNLVDVTRLALELALVV